MTRHVSSADGTRIACDVLGDGDPLVLVGGMFCHRPATADLAAALAERFTVLNYDRRSRGDSEGGRAGSDAVQREVEDLAALIELLGGRASLYGHSSGAGLAFHAAAAGLPVDRLVLHEPPWGEDDPVSVADAVALDADIRAALAEERRGDAIARFMQDAGLPDEVLEQMCGDPDMLAVAPSMAYDLAVMGESDGGVVPVDLMSSVTVRTLVLAGGASPEFFRTTAERVARLLPRGELALLEGHDHGAPASAVAPVVAEFLDRPD
ncbi:MAG: alpha/beta fold hydrolase [Microthrixaceae bacterium]